MKILLLSVLLSGFIPSHAQYVGPPNNVGREYGNPKMPMMVSHLAGANREMLKRATRNSRHSIFARILCFRKLCRIQSGHSASLNAISYKKFRKKIARNGRKGLYKRPAVDSTYKSRPLRPQEQPREPIGIDTTIATPSPVIKADSLIVLGAEVLFEINKSTLRGEYFATLDPIVKYMIAHPGRSVKISGHTDNTGSESHNLALSKRRAEAVAEYLANNGVDENRIETLGFGSSKPIAVNTTEVGREQNRRVELLLRDER